MCVKNAPTGERTPALLAESSVGRGIPSAMIPDDQVCEVVDEPELEGVALTTRASTPQEEGEDEGPDLDDDVPRSRHWHYRLVVQKTLTGEIKLRKWVSDEGPQYVARVRASDLNTHVCSFHDCGKAFPDAASLRKHMHTHGEKQYVCQVEVRSAALAASVHPWFFGPPPRHPSRAAASGFSTAQS